MADLICPGNGPAVFLTIVLPSSMLPGGGQQVLLWLLFSFCSFFRLLFYLSLFGCTGSSLLLPGFLWLWQFGAALCCTAWGSHCSGFSCCRAQALGTLALVVIACRLSSCSLRALECGLSSYDARV